MNLKTLHFQYSTLLKESNRLWFEREDLSEEYEMVEQKIKDLEKQLIKRLITKQTKK